MGVPFNDMELDAHQLADQQKAVALKDWGGLGRVEHTLHTLEHRIRQRAYEIWNAEGRADGKADEHWLAAEREVLSLLIARSPASKASAPMAENFKCSHCGALYEKITDEKTVSEDIKDAAACRV